MLPFCDAFIKYSLPLLHRIGSGLRTRRSWKGFGPILFAALLAAFLGCTDHVPKPSISLVAAKNPITLGSSTTLTATWPSSNVTSPSGSIDQGIGTVQSGVPVTITPTATTTYTFTYSDTIGKLFASVTVVVVGTPAITSFTAQQPIVTAGTSTMLTAVFTGGTGTIDHGVGAVTSGVPVSTGVLNANTTFTLTDTSPAGVPITSTVTVQVVAAVTTPVITAPATVSAGATGLTASVPVQAGDSYAWTISGGTITAGGATNQITFTAGASGAVTLGCVVTNAAGASSSKASATCTIVGLPTTPVITAPANVTAGATGLTASVPAQAGDAYTWTITGGAITAGAGTSQITFSAGTSGTVQLACVVTNTAGTASSPGSASCTILSAPGTPVITAPANVTAGATGLTASVPAQAGSTYAWTISGGAITAGAGTIQITFSAGTSGKVLLTCTVTNAAGTASLPGTTSCTDRLAPRSRRSSPLRPTSPLPPLASSHPSRPRPAALTPGPSPAAPSLWVPAPTRSPSRPVLPAPCSWGAWSPTPPARRAPRPSPTAPSWQRPWPRSLWPRPSSLPPPPD